jgi:hypothetical protein
MINELIPSGVSNDHLRAIGLVAVKWSRLEGFVYRIAYLSQSAKNKQFRAITAHMDLPRQLDVMCSLVGLIAPDTLEHQAAHAAIRKWAKYVKEDLSAKRNELIHLWWRPGEGDEAFIEAVKHRARGIYKAEPLRYTVPEIDAIATEIDQACAQLVELVEPIWQRMTELSKDRQS